MVWLRPPSAERIAARILRIMEEAKDPSRPVAFDLDGTLVEALDRLGPKRKAEVLEPVAQVAWRLLLAGARILIVTGRESEEEARADTLRALQHVAGRELTPGEAGMVDVEVGGRWAGNRVAVVRKAEILVRDRALCLVGDLPHLDGAAARKAGVPFVHLHT